MDDEKPKKKQRRNMPDGGTWSQAQWNEARRRKIASSDPICAICHGVIDMEAPKHTPLACEVDHIIPVARGGAPYAQENLQLVHMRCNRQKGVRMGSDYEELQTENLCPLSNNW